MAKIVTLGEIMLRLSPQGNDRFIQSESFRIIPGGGEANVAIILYQSCRSMRLDRLQSTHCAAMVSIPSSSLVVVTV